jgi:replicative DNA helicase
VTNPRKRPGESPERGWPNAPGLVTTIDIHRGPPYSVEAEQGVLGSMIISPREAIAEAIELINLDYFYIPAHKIIFSILIELWKASHAIDLITFTQVLSDKRKLDEVGGASFVTSLFTFVPTAANVGYYLEIVRDKYILRKIVEIGTESVRRAFEEQDDVDGLLSDFERKALEVRPVEGKQTESSMKDIIMGAIEVIEKQFEAKGAISGLATGFVEFDRMTSGLQSTEMIVIAARPSMGKTALAMNIAEHVAINEKLPVGIFSLEMSKEQLGQRLLCSRARVNLQKVRDGFLAESDFPSLTAAASKLSDSPLFIDDELITADILLARARRWKLEKGIRLLIVDYLQLLHAKGFKPNERQHEVSYVSAMLKKIAKELRIPVIVIAQLNRQPESRAGGRPRLSDLRESGSIEQDADIVALLTRPEVYEEDQESRAELAGEAELIIAKQRSGPVGEISLTFLKEFTRFEDRARNVQETF